MELTPYRLPDGRVVMVDASAAKDARIIDFALADGSIVDAIQVSRENEDTRCACGHRRYQHKRHASGAFTCSSFGCGCRDFDRGAN